MLIRAYHFPLLSVILTQPMPPYPTSYFNINLHPTPVSPMWHLPFRIFDIHLSMHAMCLALTCIIFIMLKSVCLVMGKFCHPLSIYVLLTIVCNINKNGRNQSWDISIDDVCLAYYITRPMHCNHTHIICTTRTCGNFKMFPGSLYFWEIQDSTII
jgi:hypothetical protein